MFEKNIKFLCDKDYIKHSGDKPQPVKLNLPDWYKKLEHRTDYKTVKGCIPFLDAMTFGYLLRIPLDYQIQHNVVEEVEGVQKRVFRVKVPEVNFHNRLNISIQDEKPSFHPKQQVEGWSNVDKNNGPHFYKIANPWHIITPPGYSCLFVPPLNNHDDRFSIIPGIVDTDKWNKTINFPFMINGDKYKELDTIIKKGTPYAQIIPFKRDDWKMSIEDVDKNEKVDKRWIYPLRLLHNYKTDFWSKKRCT